MVWLHDKINTTTIHFWKNRCPVMSERLSDGWTRTGGLATRGNEMEGNNGPLKIEKQAFGCCFGEVMKQREAREIEERRERCIAR